MAKRHTRSHEKAPPSDSGDIRVARLLDGPYLARLVPQLAPETLHQLIRHRGLDACGDLIASATPAQLASVFDLDLWRHARQGRDERFDEDRFGEWIEILVDAGGPQAAGLIAAIDAPLVTAGLASYVRVMDLAAVAPTASDDDEVFSADGIASSGLACDIGGYLVRSRRADAWDAIVTLLVALDAHHREYFHAVMRGCRRLSNSTPELSGFDDLLLEPEQLLHDLAVAREERRTRQGYLTPDNARAYLQMARSPRGQPPDPCPLINPIAAAYFRAAGDAVVSPDPAAPSPGAVESFSTSGVSRSIDVVVDLLAETGLVPGRSRGLLAGAAPDMPPLADIRRLMDDLCGTNNAAYESRSRELTFLANTLMAGCSVQGRPFTPQEASDAAVSICNLGLERCRSRGPGAPEGDSLLAAFELGWAALHQVSMFMADRLIATLADLRSSDADTQRGLYVLRRELVRQRDAGAPWRLRTALEVIAMLDAPSWAALLGLLDECPVLPAALKATLERRTTAVSATAFEFISTQAQIEVVRAFAQRLPELLRR